MNKEIKLPNDSSLDTVAKRLRYVIEQVGIKQTHIAKKLGISRGAVNYILNSEAKNPRSAQKIAELLEVDPDWLYSGKITEQKSIQMYGKLSPGKIVSVPIHYPDQLLILKEQGHIPSEPIGEILAQRQYNERLFAVQLSAPSTLQKFEAGEVLIFAEKKTTSLGDWVLVHAVEERRIILGVVIFQDANQINILHHKIENPLMLPLYSESLMGVYVESTKFAKI